MSSHSISVIFELLSYWHAGSGAGRSSHLDALVQKDQTGLPYLPGRTVKGLFREGLQSCEDVGRVEFGRTNELFGTPTQKGIPGVSLPGTLAFQNAVLSESEHSWLSGETEEQTGCRAALYDRFSSTQLDDQGIAVDRTLRTIELCVPLTLQTTIIGPSSDWNRWTEDMKKACVMIRTLGSHRSRGLGRCRVEIVHNP
jgi:CRISPR/Cas system CSM-associated protein Csm3 (group 7 of RAMP superfamily)